MTGFATANGGYVQTTHIQRVVITLPNGKPFRVLTVPIGTDADEYAKVMVNKMYIGGDYYILD